MRGLRQMGHPVHIIYDAAEEVVKPNFTAGVIIMIMIYVGISESVESLSVGRRHSLARTSLIAIVTSDSRSGKTPLKCRRTSAT